MTRFSVFIPFIAYLEQAGHLPAWEQQTLALFCSSAAMALRNQRLYMERESLLRAFSRFVPTEFIELDRKDVRALPLAITSNDLLTVMLKASRVARGPRGRPNIPASQPHIRRNWAMPISARRSHR